MGASLLLVRLSAIGDVVHALPSLELARAALPDAKIGWAVEAEAAPLLRGHAALDRLHVLDRRALAKAAGRVRAVAGARDFFRELRGERYDVAIDLQGLARSAVVARLAAGRTFGPAHARELATLGYTDRLDVPRPAEAHAVARSLALVRGALAALEAPSSRAGKRPGAAKARARPSPGPTSPALVTSAAARAGALATLGEVALAPYVVLLPGAGKEANRPPVPLLAESFRLLRERGPFRSLRAVILGGRGDRERAADLARRTGGVDLAGRLPLDVSAGVLERARVVVGGDTGPLHIARALGAPVVALFFAADPRRTGPAGFPGATPAVVVEGTAECAPCCARRCLRPDRVRVCLEPLEPERVAAALLEAAGELARA